MNWTATKPWLVFVVMTCMITPDVGGSGIMININDLRSLLALLTQQRVTTDFWGYKRDKRHQEFNKKLLCINVKGLTLINSSCRLEHWVFSSDVSQWNWSGKYRAFDKWCAVCNMPDSLHECSVTKDGQLILKTSQMNWTWPLQTPGYTEYFDSVND